MTDPNPNPNTDAAPKATTRATPTEMIMKAMHWMGNSPEKMRKGTTIAILSRTTSRPQFEIETALLELVESGHVTRHAHRGVGRHTTKFWPTTLVMQNDGFFEDHYKSFEWSDIPNPLIPNEEDGDSAVADIERLLQSKSEETKALRLTATPEEREAIDIRCVFGVLKTQIDNAIKVGKKGIPIEDAYGILRSSPSSAGLGHKIYKKLTSESDPIHWTDCGLSSRSERGYAKLVTWKNAHEDSQYEGHGTAVQSAMHHILKNLIDGGAGLSNLEKQMVQYGWTNPNLMEILPWEDESSMNTRNEEQILKNGFDPDDERVWMKVQEGKYMEDVLRLIGMSEEQIQEELEAFRLSRGKSDV